MMGDDVEWETRRWQAWNCEGQTTQTGARILWWGGRDCVRRGVRGQRDPAARRRDDFSSNELLVGCVGGAARSNAADAQGARWRPSGAAGWWRWMHHRSQ